MEIYHVSVGEWMNSLQNRMNSAMDGDCFYLPTPMHLHAFFLVKDQAFANKDFKVELMPSVNE
jgi:hypothetical protein